MRDYAAMTTLVCIKLQSAGTMDYSVAEVDYQIEETLKEFSTYKPHIVTLPFKIESRYGSDITGAASTLTDGIKSQFVAADATEEKVVHNITDNTWAVVKAYVSASTLTLSDNIMGANEVYKIYNKRCLNKRQIYIGDIIPEILEIVSVEFPLGNKRNWEIKSQGVLEIDVDYIPDSNGNVTNLPNVYVLVRVKRPHILSQMTKWSGLVSGTAGVKAATALAVSGLTVSSTIEEGGEFFIATHNQSYMITANATASTAGIATLSIYPGLEAVASSATVVTFTKSTLKSNEEMLFATLVASELAISKAPKFFNSINLGGGSVMQNYYTWGEREKEKVLSDLRRQEPPVTVRRYPTE